ncbi:TonB family protein [Mucilaginibacter sp. UYCu711]|uniref:TonB family protein n=1 Tax=Mucilaginibacter sp. UYCu711 TaxID=3156339 RepID=UPI003D1EF265
MNWLYYLAEANIYLGVFYLAYCLFLTKETYYQLTRAYLLFACVVSFILPVLQIGALKPVEAAVSTTINYAAPSDTAPDEFIQPIGPVHIKSPAIPHAIITQAVTTTPAVTTPKLAAVAVYHLTPQDYLMYAYLIGAGVVFLMLMIKLSALFKLIRNAKKVDKDNYKLVYLPETNAAFSFFNYLFIGANAHGADTIIRHELVHIRQKHSADIIFLELLKIVSWFNPFTYLLQNSLKTVHEYIADEQTAAYEADAIAYSSFLVSNAYGAGNSSITHSFFNYNLLKKRIIMLNQQRSGTLARLKYLVTIPICAILLCASTLAFSKTYALLDLDPAKVNPVTKTTSNKLTHSRPATIASAELPVAGEIKPSDTVGANTDKVVPIPVDETKPTTTDSPRVAIDATGHLILPAVNYSGYQLLDRHLYKNIHYSYGPDEKGGVVGVSFKLNNDRQITDLKIEQSAGDKLNALALDAFKSYKGVVNDDAGKTLKMAIYFFAGDYSIFREAPGNEVAYSGGLIITNYPHKFAVTSKGYEYDESSGGREPVFKVVIYDKNGGSKWYFSDSVTPADVLMLKDKYGYTFPTNSYLAMESITPGKGYGNYMISGLGVNSYLDEPYTKTFYDHVYNELQYPEKEKAELKASVVLVKFNVDDKGAINNVAVAKTGGANFDEAAVAAVKSFDGTISDDAGQHTIAIVFCLAQNQSRPTVSDSFKKAGYVGELARAEKKSPFTFSKKQ